MDNYSLIFDYLEQLKAENQFRSIKNIDRKDGKYIFVEGKRFLNLSSNNSLGITSNKAFLDGFIAGLDDTSFGSASARLLTGNQPVYNRLENHLAELYSKESCLLFNSGYHANVGIISALSNKGDVVFSDKLNHASIIDGIKLSDGEYFRYKHLDYEHLEQLLEKNRAEFKKSIIITESVFSMDGDIANLKRLVSLKNKYDSILIVDEAHAFGVFGDKGLGVCEQQEIMQNIDLIVGTFGKAAASIGAFATGNKLLIDYLINRARSFIFSTALPPVNVLWTFSVIKELFPQLSQKRENLLKTASQLRKNLSENGFATTGESQIVPVIIGDNEKTVKIAQELKNYGYWVLPIRPPTVPKGSSRLRLSLNADIEYSEIEKIPEIIKALI